MTLDVPIDLRQDGRSNRVLRPKVARHDYKDSLLPKVRMREGKGNTQPELEWTPAHTFNMATFDDLLTDCGSLAFELAIRGERICHGSERELSDILLPRKANMRDPSTLQVLAEKAIARIEADQHPYLAEHANLWLDAIGRDSAISMYTTSDLGWDQLGVRCEIKLERGAYVPNLYFLLVPVPGLGESGVAKEEDDPNYNGHMIFSVKERSRILQCTVGGEYLGCGIGRLLNHSCVPNVRWSHRTVTKVLPGGVLQVQLRALKVIHPGDPLVVDYGGTYFGASYAECRCPHTHKHPHGTTGPGPDEECTQRSGSVEAGSTELVQVPLRPLPEIRWTDASAAVDTDRQAATASGIEWIFIDDDEEEEVEGKVEADDKDEDIVWLDEENTVIEKRPIPHARREPFVKMEPVDVDDHLHPALDEELFTTDVSPDSGSERDESVIRNENDNDMTRDGGIYDTTTPFEREWSVESIPVAHSTTTMSHDRIKRPVTAKRSLPGLMRPPDEPSQSARQHSLQATSTKTRPVQSPSNAKAKSKPKRNRVDRDRDLDRDDPDLSADGESSSSTAFSLARGGSIASSDTPSLSRSTSIASTPAPQTPLSSTLALDRLTLSRTGTPFIEQQRGQRRIETPEEKEEFDSFASLMLQYSHGLEESVEMGVGVSSPKRVKPHDGSRGRKRHKVEGLQEGGSVDAPVYISDDD